MDFHYAIFTILATLLLLLIICTALIARIFTGKSIRSQKYPPVAGTVFHQAIHFARLHDYLGEFAKQNHTFRLLAPDHSDIYTTDIRNIEHILKTNFDMYPKGKYNRDTEKDLFGQGIFAVNGVKWRQQRKLASVEFSTRVLRDFRRFLVESEKDPEKMNDQYLRDIILNFMIAGKDTTANTLSWFFYMLSKNPLHAALTETLRLYPAVPLDGRRAETDDILPDGFKLKKGDGVYYLSYAMGRMHHIWGEDAENFRPERWLKNGIFQPESPFKFVAFHAGPRICLGKDFAYRQMKIVSIALLRFIRFRLADDTKNVTYRTMFTLHISGGLHLRAFPRPA